MYIGNDEIGLNVVSGKQDSSLDGATWAWKQISQASYGATT